MMQFPSMVRSTILIFLLLVSFVTIGQKKVYGFPQLPNFTTAQSRRCMGQKSATNARYGFVILPTGNNIKSFQPTTTKTTKTLSASSASVPNKRIPDSIVTRFIQRCKEIGIVPKIGQRKKKAMGPLLVVASFLTVWFTSSSPAWAARQSSVMAAKTVTTSLRAPVILGTRNLVAASAMLFTMGGLGLTRMGLWRLARDLLKAASRAALQLYLLGSVMLQQIMGTTNPWVVGLWTVGVGLIAGREAFSRAQYSYPALQNHIYWSVLAGGLSVLAMTIAFGILGPIEPWFQPRTLIPVAGMLFGNTLSAAALGASTITKQFAVQQEAVELRLACGATSREAIFPLVRESLLTALTPTIKGLAVTGIVHIPGMMTGQILAGQSAPQAAIYQLMITFLIATTACTSVQILVQLATNQLVDSAHHRLRTSTLLPKGTSPPKLGYTSSSSASSSSSSNDESSKTMLQRFKKKIQMGGEVSTITISNKPASEPVKITNLPLQKANGATKSGYQVLKSSSYLAPSIEQEPILEVSGLSIPRIQCNVNLLVHPGDRIGVTGQSGIGKTLVLRTLAGLEDCATMTTGRFGFRDWSVLLDGNQPFHLPDYRTKVCLVTQKLPTLEGTPRMFYEELLSFESQTRRRRNEEAIVGAENSFEDRLPMDIGQQWGLDEATFDQPWLTLSGGEAQRASLAIALATKPRLLLLDECTSALDKATSKLVEATLKKSQIPIIMVTHNEEQLHRFCTHQMKLSPKLKAPGVDVVTS